LPFDQSGVDLTAHVLRALHAWRDVMCPPNVSPALAKGLDFLARRQNTDGSWIPLWFGNQDHSEELNPVYGTARVLLAYRDLQLLDAEPARRARAWLRESQNADGGWGSGPPPDSSPHRAASSSSVEETALAVEALLAAHDDPAGHDPIHRGLNWLIEAVASGRHVQASPIGLYSAKLWYYEKLYPLIFTTSTLGEAVARLAHCPDRRAAEAKVLTG
jgi:squalene-hopene/tetraprenyl-beta-curcumene cyclase